MKHFARGNARDVCVPKTISPCNDHISFVCSNISNRFCVRPAGEAVVVSEDGSTAISHKGSVTNKVSSGVIGVNPLCACPYGIFAIFLAS